MLDFARLPIPSTMQGESLRAAVEGSPFTGRPAAFAENLWSTFFGNPRCESVRTAEWKYIRYFATDRDLFGRVGNEAEGGRVTEATSAAYAKWLTASIRGEKPIYEELFRISVDPHEKTNLAGDPAYAAVLAGLRTQCQQLVTQAKGDVTAPPATVRLPPAAAGKKKAN
jgi:hypothetical protein